MRDLDQSDVDADARDMFDNFLNDLVAFDQDDVELARLRYRYGDLARQGEPHGVAVVDTIDWIRGGCVLRDEGPYDDGSWYVEQYNRDLEAESLGRPLFPNEY